MSSSDRAAMMAAEEHHKEISDEQQSLIENNKDDKTSEYCPVSQTKEDRTEDKLQKLTVFDTTLTLTAATIGGEIIAIPFAIQRMGIWLGFSVLIIVACLSHFSSMMYIRVKDLMGPQFTSLYELAYVLFGRGGIFFVCIV